MRCSVAIANNGIKWPSFSSMEVVTEILQQVQDRPKLFHVKLVTLFTPVLMDTVLNGCCADAFNPTRSIISLPT